MSSRASQRLKLEELKALRSSKKTRLSSYTIQNEEKLFDEIDEDEYKKVQRARLDEDDFVVDDNGEGYVENGGEDWAHGQDDGDETSEDEDLETIHSARKGMKLISRRE